MKVVLLVDTLCALTLSTLRLSIASSIRPMECRAVHMALGWRTSIKLTRKESFHCRTCAQGLRCVLYAQPTTENAVTV